MPALTPMMLRCTAPAPAFRGDDHVLSPPSRPRRHDNPDGHAAPEQIGWFSRVAHETARLAGKPAAFLIATGPSEAAGSRRPITG